MINVTRFINARRHTRLVTRERILHTELDVLPLLNPYYNLYKITWTVPSIIETKTSNINRLRFFRQSWIMSASLKDCAGPFVRRTQARTIRMPCTGVRA